MRFGFDGAHRQAYPPHLFWPAFGFATLGLGLPYAWHKSNQFQYNHYRFGTTRSNSTANVQGFYVIGISIVFAVILILALFLVFLFSTAQLSVMIEAVGLRIPDELILALVVFPGFLFVYASAAAIYQVMFYKLVFNNIEIGGNRLRNSIYSISYVSLILSNTFLIIATLGFFYPWAAVRRARYLLSNIRLEAQDLDKFAGGEFDHASAQGEEFGEAFDLGLGF